MGQGIALFPAAQPAIRETEVLCHLLAALDIVYNNILCEVVHLGKPRPCSPGGMAGPQLNSAQPGLWAQKLLLTMFFHLAAQLLAWAWTHSLLQTGRGRVPGLRCVHGCSGTQPLAPAAHQPTLPRARLGPRATASIAALPDNEPADILLSS